MEFSKSLKYFNSYFSEAISEKLDLEDFEKFKMQIHERSFTLKELGISSSIYEYYKRTGLTLNLETTEQRQWVRLSPIEYLWIMTLENCRKFGMQKDILIIVREELTTKLDLKIFDTPNLKRQIIATIKNDSKIKYGEEIANIIAEKLQKESLNKLLNEAGMLSFNLLELLLYHAINLNGNAGFIVNKEFDFTVFVDGAFISPKDRLSVFEDFFSGSFVYLSYKDLLLQLNIIKGLPKELKIIVKPRDINEMFSKGVEDIFGSDEKKITFKNTEYKVIKEENISKKEHIEKTLRQFAFQDVVVKIRNGKKESIKRIIYEKAIKN